MNIEEKIQQFKKDNSTSMIKNLAVYGGLAPICTILVQEDENFMVVVAPIPEEAMANERNKKRFLSIMPLFFEGLENKNQKVICFSYSSEAWLRQAPKDSNLDNWQDLPKVEVLISSYETADESSIEINNIIRDGKIADENGKLIDCIRLEKNKDVEDEESLKNIGGRFSTIYKDYINSKN